jgi:hypothetical protein
MDNIRLKPEEVLAIRQLFLHSFPKGDHIWIFGSRTNPSARGGDIDLYVETQLKDTKEIFEKKVEFIIGLEKEIGEQKIDIVINMLSSTSTLAIHTIARETGIKLV